jgi:hypothetical protein
VGYDKTGQFANEVEKRHIKAYAKAKAREEARWWRKIWFVSLAFEVGLEGGGGGRRWRDFSTSACGSRRIVAPERGEVSLVCEYGNFRQQIVGIVLVLAGVRR